MSRAAPTLNLFAVGFPVTMALGFVILLWTLPNVLANFESLLAAAFALIDGLVG